MRAKVGRKRKRPECLICQGRWANQYEIHDRGKGGEIFIWQTDICADMHISATRTLCHSGLFKL